MARGAGEKGSNWTFKTLDSQLVVCSSDKFESEGGAKVATSPQKSKNTHMFDLARQSPQNKWHMDLQSNFHEIYDDWWRNRGDEYSCIELSCSHLVFGTVIDVVNHEYEVHKKVNGGPYLCNITTCKHSILGRGFYGRAILYNHMKEAHNINVPTTTMTNSLLPHPQDDRDRRGFYLTDHELGNGTRPLEATTNQFPGLSPPEHGENSQYHDM